MIDRHRSWWSPLDKSALGTKRTNIDFLRANCTPTIAETFQIKNEATFFLKSQSFPTWICIYQSVPLTVTNAEVFFPPRNQLSLILLHSIQPQSSRTLPRDKKLHRDEGWCWAQLKTREEVERARSRLWAVWRIFRYVGCRKWLEFCDVGDVS